MSKKKPDIQNSLLVYYKFKMDYNIDNEKQLW